MDTVLQSDNIVMALATTMSAMSSCSFRQLTDDTNPRFTGIHLGLGALALLRYEHESSEQRASVHAAAAGDRLSQLAVSLHPCIVHRGAGGSTGQACVADMSTSLMCMHISVVKRDAVRQSTQED